MGVPKPKFALKPYTRTSNATGERTDYQAIEVSIMEPMSLNDVATYIVCGSIFEFTQQRDEMSEAEYREHVEEYFWSNFDTKTKAIKAASDCFATDGRELPSYRVGDTTGGSLALEIVLAQVNELWDVE